MIKIRLDKKGTHVSGLSTGVRGAASAQRSTSAIVRPRVPWAFGNLAVYAPLFSNDIERTAKLAEELGNPLPKIVGMPEGAIPLSWWIRFERAVREAGDVLSASLRMKIAELERTLFEGGLKGMLGIERNVVFDGGQSHTLDVMFGTTAKTSTWYMGLTAGTPVFAETDTLASHTAEPTGWNEFTNYTETVRQTITFPATSTAQSIDNTASKAVFTADTGTGQTVGGLIVCENNTKGGTTGVLYSGVAFTGGDKTGIDQGDTLSADVTFTAADDGV